MAASLQPGDFRPLDRSGESIHTLVRPSRTFWQDAWSKLRHHRIGVTGLTMAALITLVAVVGPLLSSKSYSDQSLTKTYLPPSREYPMGTDNLGATSLSGFSTAPAFRLRWGSHPRRSPWSLACSTAPFPVSMADGPTT